MNWGVSYTLSKQAEFDILAGMTQASMPQTAKEHLYNFARGFCMGAADLVPGVSGGTMAFILGIYHHLLDALHAINLDFLRLLWSLRWREAFRSFPWQFLASLGLGIATAILTLSRPIHWALAEHPELVWAFFFGLVLASVSVVRKRVFHWSPLLVFILLMAAALTFYFVGLLPLETPHTPLLIFLSGAIAICAMILPGISGAFILVLLGKYRYILGALIRLDLIIILTFGAGCVIGLLSFSRLLRWLIARFHDPTIAALTGLMIGSLRKVWPWQAALSEGSTLTTLILPQTLTLYDGLALFLMISGFLLVWSIDKVTTHRALEKK
jgi:putative membrane protein